MLEAARSVFFWCGEFKDCIVATYQGAASGVCSEKSKIVFYFTKVKRDFEINNYFDFDSLKFCNFFSKQNVVICVFALFVMSFLIYLFILHNL